MLAPACAARRAEPLPPSFSRPKGPACPRAVALSSACSPSAPSLPVVPCGEPHDEVYFDFLLDDGEYPGDDAVLEASDSGCLAQFDAFVGVAYDSSTLDFYAYRPSEQSWASGDRAVSCVIWDPADQVTGSLEGAAH